MKSDFNTLKLIVGQKYCAKKIMKKNNDQSDSRRTKMPRNLFLTYFSKLISHLLLKPPKIALNKLQDFKKPGNR